MKDVNGGDLKPRPSRITATISPSKLDPPKTPAETSKSLPSHAENRRSDLQKQFSRLLDDLLVKASIAGQHINAYTGTDYSGIEALRKEILAQEKKVRDYHNAYDEAKSTHHEAHAKQTSAQREIVGLLERKSSWSPSDLERYMSLVRSEHLNEQEVQNAKDNLAAAERALEDARSTLERLERKQYHEEQIWSDTIRRNSTWVTFGLMGVNILLLLAQIAIFEPYRRKKIARDVKELLEEKTVAISAPAVAAVDEASTEIERQIDEAVQPERTKIEQAELVNETEVQPPTISSAPGQEAGGVPLSAGEMVPPEASDFAGAVPDRQTAIMQTSSEAIRVTAHDTAQAAKTAWESYEEALRDLFSERIVQMRKVDVTNAALQGAATGFAIMGLLFVLLRPS